MPWYIQAQKNTLNIRSTLINFLREYNKDGGNFFSNFKHENIFTAMVGSNYTYTMNLLRG